MIFLPKISNFHPPVNFTKHELRQFCVKVTTYGTISKGVRDGTGSYNGVGCSNGLIGGLW